MTTKEYHTVQIRIYAPTDWFGWVVYFFGRLFGAMKGGRCHATIRFIYNDGIVTERHLCTDGVRLLHADIKGDIKLNYNHEPKLIFKYKTTTRQLLSMLDRVQQYEQLETMRVTVGSLVKALLNPKKINYRLCTSFCQYVVFGKVTSRANRLEHFIKELEFYESYNRQS